MSKISNTQEILSKLHDYHRLTMDDSDIRIKASIQDIINLWPNLIEIGDQATDDELFTLNISRATLTHVFTIVLSKDFFANDRLLVRQVFFGCFSILTSNLSIFQTENSTRLLTFIDSNIRLVIKMITSIASYVEFNKNDLSSDNDQKLLIVMREHVDRDFKNDNLTDGILSFIWNLSDRTILVPQLLQAGYSKSIIEWIRFRETKFRDEKSNAPIHILHNLSRHDDGIDQLNALNTLQVIDEVVTENYVNDDTNDMTIHIAMIRALLMDNRQIKLNSELYPKKVLDMLIELSTNAGNDERYRHDGSHVSEPLTVLVKLCHNDEILHNMFSNNRAFIELISMLLIKFYPKYDADNDLLQNYTCIVIFHLLWLISNHEVYREILRQNHHLLNIINKAADGESNYVNVFMPRTLKSINQAAIDIKTNLGNNN